MHEYQRLNNLTVKKLLFVLLLFAGTSGLYAQNYLHSVGVRLGAGSGITYRRMLDRNISGELMLISQNNGTVLAFVVQKHRPAIVFNDIPLTFIWGAGAHLGMARGDGFFNPPYEYRNERMPYSMLQLGIDGFAAFEYELPRYPLSISLECKPYFELFDDRLLGIHLPVVATGIRYTF